ncbi:hypothetical protein Tsubulata_040972 [Turnera subulata]|uniref:TOG domain-containing protein n=1 Tax=Turnera subulata TaxID=218843 RepID=A0A9Q0JGN3_9ROSI|nr:hypothetical protein Tsubulata_040972 [Turnera subulata]
MKGKGGGAQESAGMELKQKVIRALNKLGDRDTNQIAAQELQSMAETLTPIGIPPFLCCILDAQKDQNPGVRKECLRLMATLATSHPAHVAPFLGKMVSAVVKRLKDPDSSSSSSVRDACSAAVAALASHLGDLNNGEGFALLAKPLWEALGEQNKQVQWGSALCLVALVRNAPRPPPSICLRMLTRTTKLLHNPHFMAKPPLIDLNTAILIQAGGATSQNVLSPALAGICEALKNSDWTTRKAASVALAEIASAGGGSYLGSLKASCIRSLESCRFDRVKPVRDAALYALQSWKSLPGPDATEPSESGSSIKANHILHAENFSREDYSNLTSNSDSVGKDAKVKRFLSESTKRRVPLSARKTSSNYGGDCLSKADEWKIEVVVPKVHRVSETDLCDEESEGSSVTKVLERTSTEISSALRAGCEYLSLDDKQDCLSESNLVADSFETKFVTVSDNVLEGGSSLKQAGRNQQFAVEAINDEETLHAAKLQDRRSLDSTVTDSSYQILNGSVTSEMACIRKQLLEIENKQSNIMEVLQALSAGITDNLCMLHSKVSGLEHEIDKIVHVLVDTKHSNSAVSKLMKQNQSISSPRNSTSTPRSSIDIRNRQPVLFSAKNSNISEDKAFSKSRPVNSNKEATDMWADVTLKSSMNTTGNEMPKMSRLGASNMGQMRKNDVFASVSGANARHGGAESKKYLWQRVKCYLSEGDLDSAYEEAICSGDELLLLELLDTTGPVLESLSQKTVSDLLCTLASYIQEHRFIDPIVVDLSKIHGPDYLVLSAKARREFYSAIQEARADMFRPQVWLSSLLD